MIIKNRQKKRGNTIFHKTKELENTNNLWQKQRKLDINFNNLFAQNRILPLVTAIPDRFELSGHGEFTTLIHSKNETIF
jgi:hypothetical protein